MLTAIRVADTLTQRIIDQGDEWTVVALGDRIQVRFPDPEKVRMSRKQWEIYQWTGKNVIVNAGTGFGKDWIGIIWAFTQAKRLLKHCRKHGWRHGGPIVVAVCAPQKSNYLPTWEKLEQMLPRIPGKAADGSPNYIKKDSEKHKSITLFGKTRGIRFEMVTLFDADSVRGAGWDICLITEAAYMKKVDFRKVVLKRVNRGGYYGAIILISTPKDNWWDHACDDAEQEKGGEFSTYKYFEATSYDNPFMDEETAERIKAQELGNPLEFEQERLAKRHVKVVEGSLDCPFNPSVVLSALSKDKPQRTGRVLLFFDLMYGGGDLLGMTAIDENTRRQIDVRCWSAKELGISSATDKEIVYTTLKELIVRQAEKFRPCRVGYDKQGQHGGALIHHLPGWLDPNPMTRDRSKKNGNVEDLLLRMQTVDAAGKSTGIILLDPDNPYIGVETRKAAKLQFEQIIGYQKVFVVGKDGNPKVDKNGHLEYYYTKGEAGDDLIDADTWACGLLPAIGTRPIQVNMRNTQRALLLS